MKEQLSPDHQTPEDPEPEESYVALAIGSSHVREKWHEWVKDIIIYNTIKPAAVEETFQLFCSNLNSSFTL